ncbi:MAG TPA: YqaJ viral recombinase family protein [Acidimicrobiia bacterium]
MRVVGTYEDRAEWLETRRQGLGASDIYGLMGTAPASWGKTPWAIYQDKMIGKEERDEEYLYLGHVFEPVILSQFAERTGLHVDHVGARNMILAHDDLPWARCSPDGIAYEGPNFDDLDVALGPVQAKRETGTYGWDELPVHYVDQMHWECFVMGREMGWVVAEHRQSIGIYEVKVDPARLTEIVGRATWFWTEHVAPQIDPPLTVDDDLAAVWPESDPEKRAQVDWDLVQRYARAAQEANAWQAQKKDLARQIQLQMEDAEVGMVDDEEVVTWKTIERRGYTVQPGSYRRLDVSVTAEELEDE